MLRASAQQKGSQLVDLSLLKDADFEPINGSIILHVGLHHSHVCMFIKEFAVIVLIGSDILTAINVDSWSAIVT